MSLLPESAFIWPTGTVGRNDFVSFKKSFRYGRDIAGPVVISLFADTRYRLFVNGTFIAYGPARFVTSHPEYDTHDITRWLTSGDNHIRVEVNFYGCSSFQTMPDGQPGFIAGGGSTDGTITFTTPGNWRAIRHQAWMSNAPLYSFAQNPAEICDTRLLTAELESDKWDLRLEVLHGDRAPWVELMPRSVPYPSYRKHYPESIQSCGPLDCTHELHGTQVITPHFKRNREGKPVLRQLNCWLHAEQSKQIETAFFWADVHINGSKVELHEDTTRGNCYLGSMTLNSGWNLLQLRSEIFDESWPLLFGLPKGASVTLHARPQIACKVAFQLSPEIREEETYGPPESYKQIRPGWMLVSDQPETLTPAREMAWDQSSSPLKHNDLKFERLHDCSRFDAQAASWCLKFKGEFYGHISIEVEAPPGTILDVACDDWMREDGFCNIYGSHHSINAVDRFWLRGGRQVVELCNPRGGIYLQVTLRIPSGMPKSALRLMDVCVRQDTILTAPDIDYLRTEDAVVDRTWQAAVNTLIASTDDSYTDCPWRERGSYIGDCLVALNLHDIISSDLRVGCRTLRNFGMAALPDGQLACCAPSWLRLPHEDFSLLWIIALNDYYSKTHDDKLIDEMWPTISRLWDSYQTRESDGLWDAKHARLFIDWGIERKERTGRGNAAISILAYGARLASAQLADARGHSDEASAFLKAAEQQKQALETRLWNHEEGRFHSSLDFSGKALHANVWALYFGLGHPHKIINYLKPSLMRNLELGLLGGQFGGHVDLYFLYFALPALAEAGHPDLAEHLLLSHYGYLQQLGCETLNECFHYANAKGGSRCHTWSSGGAIYAHRYILGFRQSPRKTPHEFLLDPIVSNSFHRAHGHYHHPDGIISIRWESKDGATYAQVEAPNTVKIIPGERVFINANTEDIALCPHLQ